MPIFCGVVTPPFDRKARGKLMIATYVQTTMSCRIFDYVAEASDSWRMSAGPYRGTDRTPDASKEKAHVAARLRVEAPQMTVFTARIHIRRHGQYTGAKVGASKREQPAHSSNRAKLYATCAPALRHWRVSGFPAADRLVRVVHARWSGGAGRRVCSV